MAKKKSLQKVTEIEGLNSIKEVRAMIEKEPKMVDAVLFSLQDRLNKSYNDKLGKEDLIVNMINECYQFLNDEEMVEEVRNTTYEINHIKITNCIHNYILEN